MAARTGGGGRATSGPVRDTDAYLADLPDDQRAALQALQETIRAAAPEAEECISYGVPAFRLEGPLVAFGAAARHCRFFLMSGSTVEAHRELLAGYDTSKGTLRFRPGQPLPDALVHTVVHARVAENRAKARR